MDSTEPAPAGAGADIAMTSRDKGTLSGFSDEIRDIGRKIFWTTLDIRDWDSIQWAVAEVEARFGHIDILVNNAGCNIRKPALEVTWEDWNMTLDTNLRGSFFVAQAVDRGMPSAPTAGLSILDRSPACLDMLASHHMEPAGVE